MRTCIHKTKEKEEIWSKLETLILLNSTTDCIEKTHTKYDMLQPHSLVALLGEGQWEILSD